MSTPKKKGATRHCVYATCSSDSRYPDRPDMQGAFFIRFPQNNKYPEKCMKWSKACSRQNFTEKDVKKDTYICSLHFVGRKGPSEDYPDPIPVTATKYDTIDDDVEDKENIQDSNSESTKRPCYHDIRNISQSDKQGIMYADSETQTSSSLKLNVKKSLKLKIENYELKRKLADITTTNTTGFSLETVQKDDKQMHFYTGLTFPQLIACRV